MPKILSSIHPRSVLTSQGAFPATITRLDTGESGLVATVISVDLNMIHLCLSIPFPLSTPVRVDVGDQMMLGEIRYCARRPEGYVSGVEISHSLKSLQEALRHWDE